MKGYKASLYSTEENSWFDKNGKVRFDGADIEILRELRKLGIHWIPPTKKIQGKFQVIEDVSLHPVSLASCWNSEWIKSREFTVVIKQSDDYLVVRRAGRVPFGLVLLLPLETASWYALVATIFLLVLAWMTVRTVRLHIIGVIAALIDIQEIVLTGGLSRTLQCASQRIVVLCGILLSIVGGNAYTGLLLGFLTVPQYFNELNTIEEARGATDRLYIVSTYKDLLEQRTDLQKIVKNITVIKTTDERDDAIKDIIQTGKAATKGP
ncbi:Uncharacterized protein GBIM_09269 [Gryllus bimaculatus]|nr:Uncharacterized protein GBIM_09269 [Gryllus bimaculatus]